MKKHKLVKMIAMLMVMIMMLSASAFAAGDAEVAPASTNGYYSSYAERTFTFDYGSGNPIRTYVTFTAKCQYGMYVPDDMSHPYYDYVQFDEITNAKICDVTDVTMYRLNETYYFDPIQSYIEYEMGNSGYKYRVYLDCNEFGDVDFYAVALY